MTFYNESKEDVLYALCLHLNNQFYREKFQLFQKKHNLPLKELAKSILPFTRLKKVIPEAEKVIREAEKAKNTIISSCNTIYPESLKKIAQPPYILFAVGNIKHLSHPKKVAIIGTRNPSLFTIYFTQKLSMLLSSMGYNIVSGMANGIDSVAQRTAIKEKSGYTIGVVAHGLEHIYPVQNQLLFQKAHDNENNSDVLLISEYPPFLKPKRYFFPRRNRIIAGLVNHLCCMEGGIKSGAMISVKHALEDGKYIYALDSEYMTNNEGGRMLIENGANNIANMIKWDIIDNDSLKNIKNEKEFHAFHKYIGNNKWIRFYLNSNFKGFP